MRSRRSTSTLTALLLVLAVSAAAAGQVGAAVVCVGDDGHVAREPALGACCRSDAAPAGTAWSDAHGCGACRDLEAGDAQAPVRRDLLPSPLLLELQGVITAPDPAADVRPPTPVAAGASGPDRTTVLRL